MSNRKFACLEGIRAILSIWVVSLHVFRTLTHATFSQNEDDGFRLSEKPWQGIVTGQGLQVDVFFMISGFLIATQFFESSAVPTIWGTCVLVLKKLLRLWPSALVVAFFSYLFTDLGTTNIPKLIWNTMTFSIEERECPISLVVTWSNQVEIISCFLLGLLMIPFKKYFQIGKHAYLLTFFLMILAILPSIYVMHIFPSLSLSVMKSLGRIRLIPMMMSEERNLWAQNRFGIELKSVSLSDTPSPMRDFAKEMYLPFYTRWTPHVVGLFLAIAVYRANHPHPHQQQQQEEVEEQERNEEDNRSTPSHTSSSSSSSQENRLPNSTPSKHEPKPKSLSPLSSLPLSLTHPDANWLNFLKHSFLLIVSLLFLMLPPLLGILLKSKRNESIPSISTPSSYSPSLTITTSSDSSFSSPSSSSSYPPQKLIDYFFFILLRPFYSIAFAYFIYRLLLPSTHPRSLSHSLSLSPSSSFSLVGGFLRWIWNPLVCIGKYTYLVYLIHFRIIIEVMYGALPPYFLDYLLSILFFPTITTTTTTTSSTFLSSSLFSSTSFSSSFSERFEIVCKLGRFYLQAVRVGISDNSWKSFAISLTTSLSSLPPYSKLNTSSISSSTTTSSSLTPSYVLPSLFQEHSFLQLLIYLTVIYGLSLLLAILMDLFVEKPCDRLSRFIISKLISSNPKNEKLKTR